jgi:magnesium and cobalt transporter
MTPRTDLVCIDVKSSFEDALRLAVKAGHSRIPVFDGTPDRIVGILYQKDLLKHWGKPQGSVSISEVMRQPYFIPESRPVWGLLKEMLSAKVHIAVVLDEYGGTAGIVAVDDIVEEILGEMSDEFSQDSAPRIRRLGQDSLEVGARIRVDRLNNELGISLPENEGYDTLGGFMVSRLGRIPVAGESFDYGGMRITVIEADDRRIRRVRIQKLPAPRG